MKNTPFLWSQLWGNSLHHHGFVSGVFNIRGKGLVHLQPYHRKGNQVDQRMWGYPQTWEIHGICTPILWRTNARVARNVETPCGKCQIVACWSWWTKYGRLECSMFPYFSPENVHFPRMNNTYTWIKWDHEPSQASNRVCTTGRYI